MIERAMFSTSCDRCGQKIRVGDLISATPARFAHVECPETSNQQIEASVDGEGDLASTNQCARDLRRRARERNQQVEGGRYARALADAGLLADPADRDSTTQWQRANNAEVRAERAEAEVAELRATVDRVRAAAQEWSRSADIGYASIGDQFLSMLDGAGDAPNQQVGGGS